MPFYRFEEDRAEVAKQAFLARWGERGVACGVGKTWWGGLTLEARVQDPDVRIHNIPRWFRGYPVRAAWIEKVSARELKASKHIPADDILSSLRSIKGDAPAVVLGCDDPSQGHPVDLLRAKANFLTLWGDRGVACGISKTDDGRWALAARIQTADLRVEDLPTEFEGYPVEAEFIGEVGFLSW